MSYRSCWLYRRSWQSRWHHHPWHHGWHHAWHLIKEAPWKIHLAFSCQLVQAEVLRQCETRCWCVFLWTSCNCGLKVRLKWRVLCALNDVMMLQLVICETAAHKQYCLTIFLDLIWWYHDQTLLIIRHLFAWKDCICLQNLIWFSAERQFNS